MAAAPQVQLSGRPDRCLEAERVVGGGPASTRRHGVSIHRSGDRRHPLKSPVYCYLTALDVLQGITVATLTLGLWLLITHVHVDH